MLGIDSIFAARLLPITPASETPLERITEKSIVLPSLEIILASRNHKKTEVKLKARASILVTSEGG
jgi:hypothetical protein